MKILHVVTIIRATQPQTTVLTILHQPALSRQKRPYRKQERRNRLRSTLNNLVRAQHHQSRQRLTSTEPENLEQAR